MKSEMEKTKFIIAIIICLILPLPALSQEKISPSSDRCSKAKSDHLATEREWSSLNTDISFIRDELERSRNFRWETKITLSVLDDALKIIKKTGTLTDAQKLTLNSRIPNDKGTINTDGTLAITGLEGKPLKPNEAKVMMVQLLSRSEEDIKKADADLKEKEKKSHLLNQKVTALEKLVEKECKATGSPTLWEQGLPRASGQDVYQRYVEKEKMRQTEVESRRLSDAERFWLRGYYDYPYPPLYARSTHFTYASGSRTLLIELKNINNIQTCLRCYPFASSGEERQIYEQLDWAIGKHDNLPCVGSLGGYRVIQIYDSIHDCYERISR
jgi:hypothetical protein